MDPTEPFQDARLALVAEAVRTRRPALVTFDVFDTLVFRRTDEPADVFARVGHRLRATGHLVGTTTPAMFGAIRREVEDGVRKRSEDAYGSAEVDLQAIYAAFPHFVLAPDATVWDLMAAEVDVERGLLVPDLEVVRFLEGLKATGLPLAAVSDFYHRADNLRDLLRIPGMGTLLDGVPIHVSCDLGFGKGSGLWKRTEEVLGLPPERIVHFGDNPVDDVRRARAAGVVALRYDQRDPALQEIAKQERKLGASVARPQPLELRNVLEPAGLHAIRGKVAGGVVQPGNLAPFWHYGATVLGPVLSGFAQWVAREAASAGVTKLACLMREGTFLARLISAAGALEGVELQPVPTWLNRRVGLAATLGTSGESLGRLLDGRSSLTVTEALGLLGLNLADVPALAGQAHTRLYDPTTRAALGQAFDEDDVLREKASAHAREISGRIARVLEQAADPSGELWLVDLGWGASIQRDAAQVLADNGSALKVTGHYLLTNERALSAVAAGLDVRSYLLDAGSNPELIPLLMRSPEVIEQVTCDRVGTQVSIDADLEPVTADLDPATAGQRRQAEVVRQGVMDFHDTWLKYRAVVPECVPSLADAQYEVLPILLRSIVAPTTEEARLFGGWRHDEGRGSAREDPLIGADHERLITHASVDRLQDLPMQLLYWPAGLVAQAAPEQAPLAQAAASGLVPWSALSAPAGQAVLRAVDAVDPDLPSQVVELRRNHLGNVLLSWQGNGADLRRLDLQLAREPHVLRLDSLEVHLWEQGAEEPRLVRLAAGDLPLMAHTEHYVTVATNVFAARAPGATVMIDLLGLRERVIYRVDVLAAYGLMAIPAPLQGRIPFESDAVEQLRGRLTAVESSATWRMTRPLRAAVKSYRRWN